MSPGNVNSISNKVRTLDGANTYLGWLSDIKAYLAAVGLDETLDSTNRAIGKHGSPEHEKLMKDSRKAGGLMKLTMDIIERDDVDSMEFADQIWDFMKKKYGQESARMKITSRRALSNYKMTDDMTIEEYLRRHTILYNEYKKVGGRINDEDLVGILLDGVSEKYSFKVDVYYEHLEDSKKTDYASVKQMFVKMDMEDKARKEKSSLDDQSHELAMNIKHRKNEHQNNLANVETRKCFNCGKRGHLVRNCRLPRTNRGMHQVDKTNIAMQASIDTKFTEMNFEEVYECESDVGCFTLLDTANRSAETRLNKDTWIVDSGASAHMTNNRDLMRDVVETFDRQVIIANNNELKVEAIGEVVMRLKNSKSNEESITLQNVLYVPELSTNLFSVSSALKNKNVSIQFNNGICTIQHQGKEVAIASLTNSLYILDQQIAADRALRAHEIENRHNLLNLWHQRLGHIGETYLRKLSTQQMVRGIPNFSEGEHLAFCEICARNKSKRVPFKGKRPQAKDIGEVLHTDLCGPMQVETPSGKRYVHVVIDDFSRMCWIRLLRNKAEAKVTLREIITFIETQSGRKVKTVRSDRGGEFVDGDLQKYFTEKGIKHYLTDKYTPEMNGTAERKNGLLMAAARCLLRQAGLPDTFWGEMVNTACYLQNRTPTSILGNITPVEAFTGEKPSVAHLRTIGTKCFVYIPKIKRQKLDEQAEEHTLVGYDISERNYRLRVGKTNRVIVSTHVKFTNIQQELNKMKYTNLEDDLLDNEIDEEIKMNQETSTNKQYDFKEELNKLLINSNIQKHNKNNEENTNVEKEPIQPRPRNLRNLERKDYAELSNFKDVALLSTDRISEIPRNVKEALSGAEANEWKQAMETEYKSLEENKTWKLCELPASRTAVGCRWVFAKKFDSEGKLQRYKARLVAQGFSQRPGIDVEQTYAPVTRIQSVRILIALGVQLDWHMHQMDVVTAYLNGTLDTMIYMKQPEGFIKEGSENLVCNLQKSLYGLKQSGRLWNIKIDCDLRKNGFKRCRADWCIYVKQENGVIIVIAIYVDDIIIMSKEIELINKTKDLLKTLYKVKDMGNIGWCLGIKINRIGENVTELSQKQYIKEKLEIFGMSDCKPIGTPMETGIKYGAWMSPQTQAEKEEMKDIPYREAVGNLQWSANMTRPDIAQAVGVASRFCQNPGVQHWKLVKRIFRYLAGTINKTLIFKKAKNEGVAKLELIGYCDADWASDVDSRKSTTGYIFFINGNAVTWRSRIQRTNALSSTEAEYMAITEAVKEGKWIQKLLKELKVWKKLQNKFIKIMEDNQGAIKLAENPISHDRTKHIDNQFHLIRDLIECKKLKIEYLNTKEMIADIMTKAVSKSDYEKHVESMNVREETVVKNNNSASGGIRELNTKLRSDKNTELSLVNKEPSDQMINSPN